MQKKPHNPKNNVLYIHYINIYIKKNQEFILTLLVISPDYQFKNSYYLGLYSIWVILIH